MTRQFTTLVAFGLFASTISSSASERIDPAGIKGSVVIAGENLPDAALDQFYQFAQRENARVVVLRPDRSGAARADTARLLERWESSGIASLEVVRLDGAPDATHAQRAMVTATGVWLVAGERESWQKMSAAGGLGRAISAVIERGGVIGGSASASAIFEESGQGLLPGAIISMLSDSQDSPSPLEAALGEHPSRVGYEIEANAALFLRGRRLWAAGGGEVRVNLAASETREAKQIVLGKPRAVADLSALRLAAIARQKEPFPTPEPPSPKIEKGTLIIIGGGSMPRGIIAEFVGLAGGDEASIVVLPTALPDPISEKSSIAHQFRQAGAKEVTVLGGRTLEEVESEEYLAILRKATGIWFGGGRQWRFADAYLDTDALDAMHGVLGRGGVIMGSSAGASIQADYLARANPLGNRDIMAEGYERGLGFIKGVAIDQHFGQRKRFKDMSTLVDRYPQLLGIGIDEGTALIVNAQIGRVSGKSRVHFYDRNKPLTEGEPDYESVGHEGRYDLVERKILDSGKSTALETP